MIRKPLGIQMSIFQALALGIPLKEPMCDISIMNPLFISEKMISKEASNDKSSREVCEGIKSSGVLLDLLSSYHVLV